MINRKFKKDLKKIVNSYYKNEYNSSTDCLELLKEKFSDEDLSEVQRYQLKKFMMLFF
ncbi:MAG: hypothetical protein ACJA1N_002425 [Saprospiraceae bacterium]|jgi:hypothetical protein